MRVSLVRSSFILINNYSFSSAASEEVDSVVGASVVGFEVWVLSVVDFFVEVVLDVEDLLVEDVDDVDGEEVE